ncbi:hypothetical protein UPYG_G00223030 [Umbra pygmaea]|uniref:Uncharacterized protein n=1 Tax=Umbra pygmaea TaxID=75934 RepID=A0ABD0WGY2_UMBPY
MLWPSPDGLHNDRERQADREHAHAADNQGFCVSGFIPILTKLLDPRLGLIEVLQPRAEQNTHLVDFKSLAGNQF